MQSVTQAVFLLDVRVPSPRDGVLEPGLVSGEEAARKTRVLRETLLRVLLAHASRQGVLEREKVRWGFKFYDSGSARRLPSDRTGFRELTQTHLEAFEEQVEKHFAGDQSSLAETSSGGLTRTLREVLVDFKWTDLILFSPVKASPKGPLRVQEDEDVLPENVVYVWTQLPRDEAEFARFVGRDAGTCNPREIACALMPPALRKEFYERLHVKVNFIDTTVLFGGVSNPHFARLLNESLSYVGGRVIPLQAENFLVPFSSVLGLKDKTQNNEAFAKVHELLNPEVLEDLLRFSGVTLQQRCTSDVLEVLAVVKQDRMARSMETWQHSWLVREESKPYCKELLNVLHSQKLILVIKLCNEIGCIVPISAVCAMVKLDLKANLSQHIKTLLMADECEKAKSCDGVEKEFVTRWISHLVKNTHEETTELQDEENLSSLKPFRPCWVENWYVAQDREVPVTMHLKKLMDQSLCREKPLVQTLRKTYLKELHWQHPVNVTKRQDSWQRHESNESSQSSTSRSQSLCEASYKKPASRAIEMIKMSQQVAARMKEKQQEKIHREQWVQLERKERKSKEKGKKMQVMKQKAFQGLKDIADQEEVVGILRILCQESVASEDACLPSCSQTVINVILMHLQTVKARDLEGSARKILDGSFVLKPSESGRRNGQTLLLIRIREYKLQVLFRMEVSWVLPDEQKNQVLKEEMLAYLRMISLHMDPQTTCTFLQEDLVDNYLYTQQELLMELYEELNYPLPPPLLEVLSPSKLSDAASGSYGHNPPSVQSVNSDRSQPSVCSIDNNGGKSGLFGGRELRSKTRSMNFTEFQQKRQIVVPSKPAAKKQLKESAFPAARKVRRNLFEEDQRSSSFSGLPSRSKSPSKAKSPRKMTTTSSITNLLHMAPRKSETSKILGRSPRGKLFAREVLTEDALNLQKSDGLQIIQESPGRILRRHRSFYPSLVAGGTKGAVSRNCEKAQSQLLAMDSSESTSSAPQCNEVRFFFSHAISDMSNQKSDSLTPTKSTNPNLLIAKTPLKNTPGSGKKNEMAMITPVKRVQFNLDENPDSLVATPVRSSKMASPRSILKASPKYSPKVTKVWSLGPGVEMNMMSPVKDNPVSINLFQLTPQKKRDHHDNATENGVDVLHTVTSEDKLEGLDQDEQLNPEMGAGLQLDENAQQQHNVDLSAQTTDSQAPLSPQEISKQQKLDDPFPQQDIVKHDPSSQLNTDDQSPHQANSVVGDFNNEAANDMLPQSDSSGQHFDESQLDRGDRNQLHSFNNDDRDNSAQSDNNGHCLDHHSPQEVVNSLQAELTFKQDNTINPINDGNLGQESSAEGSSLSTSYPFPSSSSGDNTSSTCQWAVVTNDSGSLKLSLKRTDSPQSLLASPGVQPMMSTPVTEASPKTSLCRFTRRMSKEIGLSPEAFKRVVSASPKNKSKSVSNFPTTSSLLCSSANSEKQKRKRTESWEEISPALPESANVSCLESVDAAQSQETPMKRPMLLSRVKNFTPPSAESIFQLTTSPILSGDAGKSPRMLRSSRRRL